MHEVCRRHGVMLAINHQRRFNLPLVRAKALLDAGEIGALQRMEGAWRDLADTGSHVLDMMFFFNGDRPADWVFGQIDLRDARTVFGALQAGHGIAEVRFENAVRGLYHFGKDYAENGCMLRLVGERGMIEILFDAPWLRVRRAGQAEWEGVDTGESIHDDQAIHRGVAELLQCLEHGGVPLLDSSRALRATEVIFAAHESSRRRARVDLPLPAGRCALLEMVASGELKVG
jgi:predicted dehydrogenase